MQFDEPNYICPRCQDKGVILTERVDPEGRSLGTYAAPCPCAGGERMRGAWLKPDSQGRVLADQAMLNTEKLNRMGARPAPVQSREGGGPVDPAYGALALAAMKRINAVGAQAWVAEEIAKSSSDDPQWVQLVMDMASRWG